MPGETAVGEPPAGPADYGPLALQTRLGGAGRWELVTYGGPPGSRRYFVYTPARYTIDQRVPMVVMLHGCTQTPADSAAGTGWNPLADQETFVVVYPEQGGDDNPLSCWNWFLPVHQVRGSGEAGVLAGITRQVLSSETRWNVDPGRIYVAGLSAGGAMATILGATYPDLYTAVGVHAGLEYQAATDPSTALQAMGNGGPDPALQGQAAFAAMNGHSRVVPTIVFHGTADSVVHTVNGDQVVQQWMETNRLASNDTYRPDFHKPTTADDGISNFLPYTVSRWNDGRGSLVQEYWRVTGLEHAWSGGSAAGSYSDPRGPDATGAMWAFFTHHAARE